MKVVALLEVLDSDIRLSWRSRGDTFGQCSFDIDGNKYYVRLTMMYRVMIGRFRLGYGTR